MDQHERPAREKLSNGPLELIPATSNKQQQASRASRSALFDLCPRIAQADGPIEH
jgi:hypothetical protein